MQGVAAHRSLAVFQYLDGVTYSLAINNTPNALHGGPGGWHSSVWETQIDEKAAEPTVVFTLKSPDMEEGYPGNMDIKVVYRWTDENEIVNNYWDNYEGFDKDGDNIGDTPHKVFQYADQLWVYDQDVKFFYGSPVIALLNFLAKLAPFTQPIFLMADDKPKLKM